METKETKQLHITLEPDEAYSVAMCIHHDLKSQARHTAHGKKGFHDQVKGRIAIMVALYKFSNGEEEALEAIKDIDEVLDYNIKNRTK